MEMTFRDESILLFFPSQQCERHRRVAPLRTDTLLFDVEEPHTLLKIILSGLVDPPQELVLSLTSGVTSSPPWAK